LAFLELLVVLLFGVGWLILEWQCRRLDRARDNQSSRADSGSDPQPPLQSGATTDDKN
jgi:hypothetical protein